MASGRLCVRGYLPGLLVAVLVLAAAGPAAALQIDDRGEMRLGLRAYTDARVGTQRMGDADNPLSFPVSPEGHLRQHRYFLQIKWDHDLTRLSKETYGYAAVLRWLDLTKFSYSLQYRGEWEGIYNYGPSEFSKPRLQLQAFRKQAPNLPPISVVTLDPDYILQRDAALRRVAVERNRLFLAYVDVEKGPVFVRIGKQVLSWGETDVFRLLDNINPLDNGFGGFFIPLDERRMPLEMARGSYQFGSIGPLNDVYVEGFAAFGNTVATQPGIPAGSPWQPGGLNYPTEQIKRQNNIPDRMKLRGGGRVVFNAGDVTASIAQYWTYLDIPGVTFRAPGGLPSFDNFILAEQHFPRVPITGGSFTFPVPAWYLIVRGEMAYFWGQPFNRQGSGSSALASAKPGTAAYNSLVPNLDGGLNPFIYPGFTDFCLTPTQQNCRRYPIQSKLFRRDSFNFSLGLDRNQWVRWLNPHQTFFVTTQLFFSHVLNAPDDLIYPVPFRNVPVDPGSNPVLFLCQNEKNPSKLQACRLQPRYFHINQNQILQTLAIFTSYAGGRITPILSVFYDWQGAILVQPGVTLTRDPFRLVMDWTGIFGAPTGQLGTQRDRDNVRFQVEYTF